VAATRLATSPAAAQDQGRCPGPLACTGLRCRLVHCQQLVLATNLRDGPCCITHSAHSWLGQIIQFRTRFKRSAEYQLPLRTAAMRAALGQGVEHAP
jgi:hypothetical protein